MYFVLSVLVYTFSWHFISRYINKNVYEILDQVKGIVVNRTCHSINGRFLGIMLTDPSNCLPHLKFVFLETLKSASTPLLYSYRAANRRRQAGDL